MRQAIHVGNRTFNDGSKVEKYLREDMLKSVKPWLTEIMNNYKVRELFQLLSILGSIQITQIRGGWLSLICSLTSVTLYFYDVLQI